jgi:hypothetical protein
MNLRNMQLPSREADLAHAEFVALMNLQETPVTSPDFLEKLRALTLAQKVRREG